MSGWAGLLGTFLPLLLAVVSAWRPIRGASLWTLSLAVHLISWACFVIVLLTLYAGSSKGVDSVLSPVILTASQWSGATALRWDFSTAVFALAACSVMVSFHFIARELIQSSRATAAGLAGYLCSLLGALGANHPLLFCAFMAGAVVPRLVFTGMDVREGKIEAVKETAFLSIVALLSLLVCVLAFAEPFQTALPLWFKIEGANRIVLPGSIGIILLLLAASISAGIFPFHGNARRIFQLERMERAVPLALQPFFGFALLFRFGLSSFPNEFRAFSPHLLGLFSVGVAYCAVGFLGSRSSRDRVFWLQQVLSCFVAVGFFSLSVKGWHGAQAMLIFECMAIPFFLLVLACHERRPPMPAARELGRYPAFALSTAMAALYALFLPVSIGFYGALLVTWSLVGVYSWPLPFLIFSMPLIAFAGVRIMYFRLGEMKSNSRLGEMKSTSRESIPQEKEFTDLHRDELVAILPLGLTLFLLGILPRILLGPMGTSITNTLKGLGF